MILCPCLWADRVILGKSAKIEYPAVAAWTRLLCLSPHSPHFFLKQQQDIFFPLSRVQWGGVLGVPQAAVPGGNIDVAGT